MKLLIDSADVNSIRKLIDYYPIDGVTTNPSILVKSARRPYDILQEIRSLIGSRDLHVQVISASADDLLKEAHSITEKLGKDTFVKVPVTFEGVKAIRLLSDEGIKCTGTAVYTIEQAYLAGKAGAKWVAPYVNRIEKLGTDGIKLVSQMKDMFRNNNMDTQILGASFHRIDQITGLAICGVDAATVSADMLLSILDNENVKSAVAKFVSDFEGLYGKGSTML